VAEVAKELQALGSIDGSLTPPAKRVEEASFQLEDVATDLRGYLHHVIFDNDRLEDIELRLDLLQKLKRKYGGSLESVLDQEQEVEEQLQRISMLPEHIAEAEEKLDELYKKLSQVCLELSRKRRKAAEQLSVKVQQELATLKMSGTRFEVSFTPNPVNEDVDSHLLLDDMGIEATGVDRIDFLIAPNVGEDLKPLAQTPMWVRI
jgi:DNA repair protein RecN (Recombination protein N)